MVPATVRIVGCGRWSMGDDQAGLVVASCLTELGLPDTLVVGDETPGCGLVPEQADGTELLVLVDAAPADDAHPAGSFARIDYRKYAELLAEGTKGCTHTLGVSAGLRLAGELGVLPGHVWIYVLFGTRFERHLELSAAVREGVEPVVERIELDVKRWLCARD